MSEAQQIRRILSQEEPKKASPLNMKSKSKSNPSPIAMVGSNKKAQLMKIIEKMQTKMD